jgi:ABC-type antimicrobial peptide transport system permease subunit
MTENGNGQVCKHHSGLIARYEYDKDTLENIVKKLEHIEETVNSIQVEMAFMKGKSKIVSSISGFISGIFSGAAVYFFK